MTFADQMQRLYDDWNADPPVRDYTVWAQDVSHLYTTYDLGADPQHADPLPLNSGHAIAYYAQDDDGDAEYVCTKWSDGPIVEDYVIELIPERATCV